LTAAGRKSIVAAAVPEIAYVNGEFLPLDRALVHVEDRGFQFADAVYEVVRTYGGRPFAVDDHLGRLFRSLKSVEIRHGFTAPQLTGLIHEAVQRAAFPEAMVYLQISRGQARRHRGFPADALPTLVMTVRELEASAAMRTGVSVITVPDTRWMHCDIKSVGLLANVLAYNVARQAGAHDAIFVEADGNVNEATAGNLFVVTGNVLRTPPKGPRILAGVTRDKLLRTAGMPVAEERIRKDELYSAVEIFISSTTAEVVPVIAVDGKPIGAGIPGPIARRVYEAFVATLR
jgi:D-alanine transaminase